MRGGERGCVVLRRTQSPPPQQVERLGEVGMWGKAIIHETSAPGLEANREGDLKLVGRQT